MEENEDRPGDRENGSGPAPLSDSDARKGSVVPLILCLGVLVLGVTMSATPERAAWMGIEGPPCPSRWLPDTWALHEAGCPGCGLTRATGMAVQGEVRSSFRVHPAGIVVAILAAFGALLHGFVVATDHRSRHIDSARRAGRWLLLLALAAGWIARLI